ncbi:MAG: [FeFe] hydrogenase H-cluster radical SAM maturase HydG [Desulforhopalus sp.]|nr:[FeFe] hydrogenase H-cluster radical SAM maturase HydG [Desulforhopalus sp.]
MVKIDREGSDPMVSSSHRESLAEDDYPDFIDHSALSKLALRPEAGEGEIFEILSRAAELKGLNIYDAAALLSVRQPKHIRLIMAAAEQVKLAIYGRRMVMFAPLYTSNYCVNNCLYCGFRKDNKDLTRRRLSIEEICAETRVLLKEGHKRLLVLSGETGGKGLAGLKETLQAIYQVRENGQGIRRINVEIAPLSTAQFRQLKTCNIGTYICFQETYDQGLYSRYHRSGPKADYKNRLFVMHRAMEAGIDDVGIGALFGLADHRFETLALLRHAEELERIFGCGPHTVSVPRIEPAHGAPVSTEVPFPVDDDAFRTIIAVLRLSLPYTGIILSTRENAALRHELFRYGVSQISAGSRTAIGGYSEDQAEEGQFSLGDQRPMEEVIRELVDMGFIPSFCTGCYRKGRVGKDFMDLAKPGLIKSFCHPNGLVSFAEYLTDFAGDDTRRQGFDLIDKMVDEEDNLAIQTVVRESLVRIAGGERDIYL